MPIGEDGIFVDEAGHRGSMSSDNDPVFSAVDSLCQVCVHRTSVWNCRAFPDGIPRPILRGDFMHTTSYPGDQGILFKRGTNS